MSELEFNYSNQSDAAPACDIDIWPDYNELTHEIETSSFVCSKTCGDHVESGVGTVMPLLWGN